MRIAIDLLSDTVTKPTQRMLRAMADADVGDDVYGEDPSANELEKRCAALFEKEAACFVASGTMGNLLAMLAWCPRGKAVLVGDQSDIFRYEAGAASWLGGVVLHPIATNDRGELTVTDLGQAVGDASDFQLARPGLVCLEHPHNLRGGIPLELDYIRRVAKWCRGVHLPIHVDGARIFNAAVATGIPVAKFARHADSVQFCFSKSLAAPVGSMVLGRRDFIDEVRRLRKAVGGGMRQVGYLAAAASVALDDMIDRLVEDHRRARRLAVALAEISSIDCDASRFATNMVYFGLPGRESAIPQFLADMRRRGVRMGALGDHQIRAVTHYQISDADIDRTIQVVQDVVGATWARKDNATATEQ